MVIVSFCKNNRRAIVHIDTMQQSSSSSMSSSFPSYDITIYKGTVPWPYMYLYIHRMTFSVWV